MPDLRYTPEFVHRRVIILSGAALTLLEMVAAKSYTHSQRNRMDFAVKECLLEIREAVELQGQTPDFVDDETYIPF